jgi:hypothetical protein
LLPVLRQCELVEPRDSISALGAMMAAENPSSEAGASARHSRQLIVGGRSASGGSPTLAFDAYPRVGADHGSDYQGVPPLAAKSSLSRSSSDLTRDDDDFDVLANGVVVGRIFKANAAPVGLGEHEAGCPSDVLRCLFFVPCRTRLQVGELSLEE